MKPSPYRQVIGRSRRLDSHLSNFVNKHDSFVPTPRNWILLDSGICCCKDLKKQSMRNMNLIPTRSFGLSFLLCFFSLYGIASHHLALLACAQTKTADLEFQQRSGLNEGGRIYEASCVDCHGGKGEGVEGAFSQSLQGVMTLDELTRYVEATMPEGDPESCVGEEAKAVSKFIFEKFYSIDAQNRRNPPTTVFSRLTRVQHVNVIADLVASFSNRRESIQTKHGLRAAYFSSRSQRRDNLVKERIDRQIDFDFGEGVPTFEAPEKPKGKDSDKTEQPTQPPEKAAGKSDKKVEAEAAKKMDGKEFSIRWSGSLIAEESGEYEMVVRSANSVRLFLNNQRKALVDANVVSGELSEYRGRIALIGGRNYDLQVSVARHKEKKASVQLCWVRPNGVQETIPSKNFSVERSQVVFVPNVKFPPDDESYGYPRGISISKEWTESVSKAAIQTALHISKNIERFVKDSKDKVAYRKSAKEFCLSFAEKAFRSPLSEEQKNRYVDSQFSEDIAVKESIKRSIVLILKSPLFLYVDLAVEKSNPAFWLAMTYWDSIPNREIQDAQDRGQLMDKSNIDWRLEKMLMDNRARIKLRHFFEHWLKLAEFKNVTKDAKLFPDFDGKLAEDLRESLLHQIDDAMWGETSDFRELIDGKSWFVNKRIADYYGSKIQADDEPEEFRKVDRKNGRGILTHPFLMSGFAYSKSSSPIHRGVFLTQNVLGRRLNPPPDAFPPFDGEIAKTWTTREKVEFQTKPIACQRCHCLINDLGFALEEFDAVGKYRKLDNLKPVNSTGEYMTADGKLVKYNSANELTAVLRDDRGVHENFVEELFQFLVKQPLAAFGSDSKQRLIKHFVDNNFNVKKLLIEIGKVAAFHRPNDSVESSKNVSSQ